MNWKRIPVLCALPLLLAVPAAGQEPATGVSAERPDSVYRLVSRTTETALYEGRAAKGFTERPERSYTTLWVTSRGDRSREIIREGTGPRGRLVDEIERRATGPNRSRVRAYDPDDDVVRIFPTRDDLRPFDPEQNFRSLANEGQVLFTGEVSYRGRRALKTVLRPTFPEAEAAELGEIRATSIVDARTFHPLEARFSTRGGTGPIPELCPCSYSMVERFLEVKRLTRTARSERLLTLGRHPGARVRRTSGP